MARKSAVITPPLSNSAEMRKWQTEEALRTMTRAEEIRRDPKLMADVKKLASVQQRMLSSVAGKPTVKRGSISRKG